MKKYLSVLVAFILVVTQFTFLGFGNAAKEGIVYVYSSNIFGPESDKFGLANVSWLSGTAAWMYIAATQYILGIKPTWNGLSIKPCLPPEWKNIKVKRGFRGKTYNIDYPSIAHNTSIMEEGEKVK